MFNELSFLIDYIGHPTDVYSKQGFINKSSQPNVFCKKGVQVSQACNFI